MSTVRGVSQLLTQDALVRMYILDLSNFAGGPILRFTDALNGTVHFGGQTYLPTDIELNGLELNTTDSSQYPSVRVVHLGTPAAGYLELYDDFIGAKFYRIRTYRRFLDDGVEADPTQMFPMDKFFIERLTHLDGATAEFELRTALNYSNRQLPKRMVLSTYCDFVYRRYDAPSGVFVHGTCPWNGAGGTGAGPYIDESGATVTDPNKDVCSKKLGTGCRARFGQDAILPYRGFPGLRRVR